MSTLTPAPVCWVVTDGRAGNLSQATAFAEAMARLAPLEIKQKCNRIAEPWRSLPRMLWGDPFNRLTRQSDRLDPPFPDLWIGCGRASVPLTIAVKEKSPATYTIQLQNPRAPLEKFDLVIPPLHDGVAGENVFAILGSANRIERAGATPAREGAGAKVAVLIGGPNRAFGFGADEAERIAAQIAALGAQGFEISVTSSRRTPIGVVEPLRLALKGVARNFWRAGIDDAAENPYPAMLRDADFILVTEDSVNMAAEAATTGRPVYVLLLPRKPFASARKFDAFHESLRACGASRVFYGRLDHWEYPAPNETARAAEEALLRWRAFASRQRVR